MFEEAAAGVAGAFPTQLPQIDGDPDRAIFGVTDFAPMRFIPVVSRTGNVVTLGGGAAQTVDVGSRWAAYPPATHETRDGEAARDAGRHGRRSDHRDGDRRDARRLRAQ